MRRKPVILALAAIGLALAATPAAPELKPTARPPEASRPAPLRPMNEAPLRAQCWQRGVKIIDESGLAGLSINSATRQNTVTFKRDKQTQASVFLLPLADALCLLQPEP